MREYMDQLGRRVRLAAPPARIVSLVPSVTETVYDLGGAPGMVGVTRFCIYPEEARRVCTVVGGTKRLHLERIAALAPDLILAEKEENVREQVEWLAARFPVWVGDVTDFDSALELILSIGKILRHEGARGSDLLASSVVGRIQTGFSGSFFSGRPSVAYLIWYRPWMVAGGGTFIDSMLARIGLRNVFGHLSRYPSVTEADLRAAAPDYVFLSSEPFPFRDVHVAEMAALVPSARVMRVDGTFFSWYGTRMLGAPAYFRALAGYLAMNWE